MSAGSYVEFDDHGVTDVGVTAGAGANVGPAGVTVETGMGWNAGGSGSAGATLGNLSVGSQ